MNKNQILGLAVALSIAAMAWGLAVTPWAAGLHLSALTLAIVIGMALGNSLYPKIEAQTLAGINLAKTFILRTGIMLYGFRITLQDIHAVGVNGILTDSIMLIATFFITIWIGIRLLHIDRQIVQLTAAGCSICGAAAIMAASPVVKAESHQVSVAVALIVIFGTLAMFLYPLMFPWLNSYLSEHQFGIYIGSSVHEVAQVYAAGGSISPTVADTAVISKMIRVMMLAPFLFGLSYFLQKEQGSGSKITMPWFAVYFIGVAMFNSLGWLPKPLVEMLVQIDNLLLMMAMAALGLTTRVSAIKQAGVKPLLLGALVCLWLMIGGFSVNWAMERLFG